MNDVKVVIELSKASPRAGFGMPLIFAGTYIKDVPYTEVGSLAEVKTAGFEEATAVYKAAQLLFQQNNAPSKIAVCGSSEATVTALPNVLHEGWRQLIVIGGEGDSTVDAISAYIAGCGEKKLYFASVKSSDSVTVKDATRTVLVVYETTDVACPEAALVGATAGMDAGSITYKNIILKGVTAQDFTDSEVAALHKAGMITILKKAGDIVTSEGIVASGEYIDIMDCQDYIIEQIQYQSQSLMNRVYKLHYDNRGIAALEGVVVSVLKDAANQGMIAQIEDGDYAYSVTFLPREECADSDISARHYTGGSFEFTLAGAIHTAKITGQIIA